MQVDVGKLVGAASAPVALIIAASIFLSNLGGKYAVLVNIFRDIAREYRQQENREDLRSKSLEEQMRLQSGRLRNLMRATFWLAIAIHCFILTVIFTSVGVIFPKVPVWTWVTAFFSFAGMVVLGGAVVLEMVENHRSKEALMLETAEFFNVLESADGEERKRSFVDGAGAKG